VGAPIDGSTTLVLFVLARCGSSLAHLLRAEHTACVAVRPSSCAAYVAILQGGLALHLWVLFFDLIFHHGVPTIGVEPSGRHRGVRDVRQRYAATLQAPQRA
jgi:hypothetical protein